MLAHSGLSAHEFLDLVDEGHVRVIGREWWLMSKDERDDHPYKDARWTPEIDDTLKKWCKYDAVMRPGDQRVAVIPPEDGYEWADEHLGEDERRVKTWYDRYRRSPRSLPSGTLDTIARNVAKAAETGEDVRYAVARTILRDGRNHGQALQAAGADISVHLSKVSVDFMRILNDESGRPAVLPQRGAEPIPSEAMSAELARQTAELLRWLRDAAGTGPMNLREFLRQDVREEILDWLGKLCNEYRLHSPAVLDGVVLAQLEHDLARGRFSRRCGPAVAVAHRWAGYDARAGRHRHVAVRHRRG
jgi:hypothetical protein